VFWVVDNGSSHRGQKAIDRLAEQFPNAIMVHTPVHASWLNQVEIHFSIIARKVSSPNDFDDLDVVIERLAAFETRSTRPRIRSSGSSPAPTWPTSWTDSTDTGQRSVPTQLNPAPPDPRRTYERDH